MTPEEFFRRWHTVRQEAEIIVERLIGLLDAVDAPDEDREDEGDAEPSEDSEPSLGSLDREMNQEQAWTVTCDCASDVDLECDPMESGRSGKAPAGR